MLKFRASFKGNNNTYYSIYIYYYFSLFLKIKKLLIELLIINKYL